MRPAPQLAQPEASRPGRTPDRSVRPERPTSRSCAAALTAAVRGEDTVARIGGDEFTILIEDMRDKTSLSSVVEKVLCAFDHEFQLGESSIRVTPSLGVSLSPDDGQDAETLMHNADAAMYRAKAAGRNTYKFYTG